MGFSVLDFWVQGCANGFTAIHAAVEDSAADSGLGVWSYHFRDEVQANWPPTNPQTHTHTHTHNTDKESTC